MQSGNAQAKEVVLTLLKSAVPERAVEIESLWSRYKPAVEVSPDGRQTTMKTDRNHIQFDNKTMNVLWLLGFNGWRSIDLYSPAILGSMLLGFPIDTILQWDGDRGPLEADHKARASMADQLIRAKNLEDVPWPEDIPQPVEDRGQLSSDEEKATFDLVAMAVAFVIFHEFRHFMFFKDGGRPEEFFEEEAMCDVWARSFMTDKIGDYARTSGNSHQAILQKRAMAMALGAVILHDITPEITRWGSAEYPPIADRIHTMIGGIGPSPDSKYWFFAACLLTSIFRRAGRSLPMVASDPKALVEELIEQLR